MPAYSTPRVEMEGRRIKEVIWQITAGAPSPNKLEILIQKSPTEVILIYMSKNKSGSTELDQNDETASPKCFMSRTLNYYLKV